MDGVDQSMKKVLEREILKNQMEILEKIQTSKEGYSVNNPIEIAPLIQAGLVRSSDSIIYYPTPRGREIVTSAIFKEYINHNNF